MGKSGILSSLKKMWSSIKDSDEMDIDTSNGSLGKFDDSTSSGPASKGHASGQNNNMSPSSDWRIAAQGSSQAASNTPTSPSSDMQQHKRQQLDEGQPNHKNARRQTTTSRLLAESNPNQYEYVAQPGADDETQSYRNSPEEHSGQRFNQQASHDGPYLLGNDMRTNIPYASNAFPGSKSARPDAASAPVAIQRAATAGATEPSSRSHAKNHAAGALRTDAFPNSPSGFMLTQTGHASSNPDARPLLKAPGHSPFDMVKSASGPINVGSFSEQAPSPRHQSCLMPSSPHGGAHSPQNSTLFRRTSARSLSSSYSVRRHVSLKNMLNLGTYEFVQDVDVSVAQSQVDSSEDEEDDQVAHIAELYGVEPSHIVAAQMMLAQQLRSDSLSAGGATTPTSEGAARRHSLRALAASHLSASRSAMRASQGGVDRASPVTGSGAELGVGLSNTYDSSVPHSPHSQSHRSSLAAANNMSTVQQSSHTQQGSIVGIPPALQPINVGGVNAGQGSPGPSSPAAGAGSNAGPGGVQYPNSPVHFSRSNLGDPMRNSRASLNTPSGQNILQHSGSMPMDLDELEQSNSMFLEMPIKDKASNILAVSPALPRDMRRSMWSVKDFNLHKCLHKGYASHVYSADCKLTKIPVVLKVYRLSAQCDLQRVQLYREICVHSRLQHQNVIQFYAAFLEDNCVIIIQEYAAGGDLLRFMYQQGGRLSERQAVRMVLAPFLSALHYLHTQEIIHRDIKPENCLLTENQVLKLADFGLAVDLRLERANTRAGTLDYMAPEVLRCPTKETPDQFKSAPGAAHYDVGADAWAVGVFAYELVVGGPPFKASQMIDTARNIIAGQVNFPQNLSEAARDFITACLRKHPGDRPTVLDMLRMPWITALQRRQSVITGGGGGNMMMSSMSGRMDLSGGGLVGIGAADGAAAGVFSRLQMRQHSGGTPGMNPQQLHPSLQPTPLQIPNNTGSAGCPLPMISPNQRGNHASPHTQQQQQQQQQQHYAGTSRLNSGSLGGVGQPASANGVYSHTGAAQASSLALPNALPRVQPTMHYPGSAVGGSYDDSRSMR